MNRDQKLLEEAYEKVYQTALLPEEDLFIENISQYITTHIYNNLKILKNSNNNHRGIGNVLKLSVDSFLSILNPPAALKDSFKEFYIDFFWSEFASNTSVENYYKENKTADRTVYISFFKIDPEDVSFYEDIKTDVKNKEEILKNFKTYLTYYLNYNLEAYSDDKEFRDIMVWRKERFGDIRRTKELSGTFREIDVLQDF